MRRAHILLRRVLVLGAILLLSLIGYAWIKQRPQDLPWTELDLAQPVGLFTGRKLATLTQHPDRCRGLLKQAGIGFTAVAPGGSGQCAYDDAIRLQPDTEAFALSPRSVAPSCPVAAALKLWEWHVVQPAAVRLFGQRVKTVAHFGSFSCRRLYGRSVGDFSEHATADAIDIAAFTLTDGRRLSVVSDWSDGGADAQFLREVRDGACRLFSTVLSPDYNAAHRDHLHLDQAERGVIGGRLCR